MKFTWTAKDKRGFRHCRDSAGSCVGYIRDSFPWWECYASGPVGRSRSETTAQKRVERAAIARTAAPMPAKEST